MLDSEKLWRNIFEEATNAFLMIDDKGKLLMANKRAKEIFGPDVVNRHTHEVLSAERVLSVVSDAFG